MDMLGTQLKKNILKKKINRVICNTIHGTEFCGVSIRKLKFFLYATGFANGSAALAFAITYLGKVEFN